ncbi:hypothetical protein [Yeosuana sp. AK3]
MSLTAQETILKTDFSVRDFSINNDSIFLIEKRDVKYYNFTIKSVTNDYFIGGYGLKLFNDTISNEIITVSSEFTRPVTSLRFYNKKTKVVGQVFYYQQGRSIDALILPKFKYAVLSLSDKKIIIVDYSNKPSFETIHTIPLKSISRKVSYYNNNLYYATDKGEVFIYNFETKTSKPIYNCEKIITNFSIFNNSLVCTTIDGEIVKFNMHDKTKNKIKLTKDFVLNTAQFEHNKLICGTFNGAIIVIDIENMTILNQWEYHQRSVLKISKGKDNEFYSSSIDKTIKKWIISL